MVFHWKARGWPQATTPSIIPAVANFETYCFPEEELEQPIGLVLLFHKQPEKQKHLMETLLVFWKKNQMDEMSNQNEQTNPDRKSLLWFPISHHRSL